MFFFFLHLTHLDKCKLYGGAKGTADTTLVETSPVAVMDQYLSYFQFQSVE